MRHVFSGKLGWAVAAGCLLTFGVSERAQAAPANPQFQIAIGNPTPNSLIAGRVSLSVAYNQGLSRVTAFTIYVDDRILYSQNAGESLAVKGIHYLPVDTNTLTDGNHVIRVVAIGTRGKLGEDQVAITVRNGLAGGPDVVPPLVQFRQLLDGQEISGTVDIDLLAEDNTMQNLFVSIFVNQEVKLLKNVPPYTIRIDTAKYLDPKTGKGEIRLEAWAFDRANNLGKARPIVLNVRPVGATQETRVQADPTTTRVEVPATVKPPTPAQGSSLDVTLPGPKSVPSDMRLTPPSAIGNAAGGGLAGTPSTLTPATSGPGSKPAATVGEPAGPDVLVGASGARAGLSGARSSTPGARVLPAPPAVGVATPAAGRATRPAQPALGSARSVAPRPAGTQMARNTIAVPDPMGGLSVPVPVPAAGPMLSGQRAAEPPATARPAANADRVATARNGENVIVVVPAGQKPDANGKIRAQVYRPTQMAGGPLPRDREYRPRSGESLAAIANRFKVTPKSIQIANGLAGQSVPAGSILKIPGTFDIVMNNKRVAFDVTPRIQGGLPLAPFRQIFEHAGGAVVYFPDTREVRAANDDKDIKLKIGSKEATVNQVLVVMEREAFIDSGRTIVPVSFMEKALDLKAEYDVKTGTVVLLKK